jgi:UDP-3-O-[3-hydroxymyristoyl] glucosamine N-acyltransferase
MVWFCTAGRWHLQKNSQLGNVVLEDDVEIGANTTIDCGTLVQPSFAKGQKLTTWFKLPITAKLVKIQ